VAVAIFLQEKQLEQATRALATMQQATRASKQHSGSSKQQKKYQ
jgi:hypothetical protein